MYNSCSLTCNRVWSGMACRFILDGKDALEFRHQKGLCNLIFGQQQSLAHFNSLF